MLACKKAEIFLKELEILVKNSQTSEKKDKIIESVVNDLKELSLDSFDPYDLRYYNDISVLRLREKIENTLRRNRVNLVGTLVTAARHNFTYSKLNHRMNENYLNEIREALSAYIPNCLDLQEEKNCVDEMRQESVEIIEVLPEEWVAFQSYDISLESELEILNFSQNTYYVLKRHGINTLKELLDVKLFPSTNERTYSGKKWTCLSEMWLLDAKSENEIITALYNLGYLLKDAEIALVNQDYKPNLKHISLEELLSVIEIERNHRKLNNYSKTNLFQSPEVETKITSIDLFEDFEKVDCFPYYLKEYFNKCGIKNSAHLLEICTIKRGIVSNSKFNEIKCILNSENSVPILISTIYGLVNSIGVEQLATLANPEVVFDSPYFISIKSLNIREIFQNALCSRGILLAGDLTPYNISLNEDDPASIRSIPKIGEKAVFDLMFALQPLGLTFANMNTLDDKKEDSEESLIVVKTELLNVKENIKIQEYINKIAELERALKETKLEFQINMQIATNANETLYVENQTIKAENAMLRSMINGRHISNQGETRK